MVMEVLSTEVPFWDLAPNTGDCLPLFARVERELVHSDVKHCAQVIQAAVVPEGSPLHVDTHPALLSIHQLHITHLLHVAGVASSTCQSEATNALSTPAFHPARAMQPHRRGINSLLTYNEANFTVRVFIATSHHSPNCVIHHGDHIQVELLMARGRRCLLHKSQIFKTHTRTFRRRRTHIPKCGPILVLPAPAQTKTYTSTG